MNFSNYSNNNNFSILTEQINLTSSDLDIKSTFDIVNIFSEADKEPQKAVNKAIPEIVQAIDEITLKLKSNGRLFYIGAGTSGRLGVLDASECPPTFCTSSEMVQGIIAGGESSLTKSSESLEDQPELAISNLKDKQFSNNDVLIGITASGKTPYVVSALKYSKSINALTISISSVPYSDSSLSSDIDIRLLTGPEIIAGSTRLKAGTATKMALNIISTSVMIKLGKVYGNRMIDLSVTNNKLLDRALGILLDIASVNKEDAIQLLKKTKGSVKLSLLIALSNSSICNSPLSVIINTFDILKNNFFHMITPFKINAALCLSNIIVKN